MTGKKDYTDDAWATLRRAPIVAGFAISLADPGGPIELSKETMATLKAIGRPGSDEELLVAVSQDAMAMAQQHQNPVDGLDLKGATAGQQVLDELRKVDGILRTTATPAEADAFRAWIIACAQAAANAAKEGGFMGFGAVLVSDGEQKMLEQVTEAIGAAS